jgi:hypothetical protein
VDILNGVVMVSSIPTAATQPLIQAVMETHEIDLTGVNTMPSSMPQVSIFDQ